MFSKSVQVYDQKLSDTTNMINFRFDVIKKQELKQRKIIETACVKMLKIQKLKKVFYFLKNVVEEKQIYEKKQRIANRIFFMKLKSRFFNSWKQFSVSGSVVAKKLQKTGEREKKAIEETYNHKLAILKSRIIEVEQKIQLTDKSVAYFMEGISSSYQQAINLLNNEMYSFQKPDDSQFIRFREIGCRITVGFEKFDNSIFARFG